MQTQVKRVSPEEYLELERKAEFRSEYRNGEIIPMTGGTIDHNRIAGNVYAFLKYALRGKGAEPFFSDLRLWIPDYQLYTYPDVMVIEGAPIFLDDRKDTVTNPSLIVEVLSKSTQGYDCSDKFKMYRSVPQFREYVLIDQYQIEIEHYTKTSEGWLLREYGADAESISLRSFGIEAAIADLYEGVTLESAS
ncbi:Uma2 family endonuclease [Cyanobacteria bacterium FACHB-63]|nr:Uma2 family endonuclease [Cyanobacteria bacterium FACHB-63]